MRSPASSSVVSTSARSCAQSLRSAASASSGERQLSGCHVDVDLVTTGAVEAQASWLSMTCPYVSSTLTHKHTKLF